MLSILWGWLIDKRMPDRFDLIGGFICVIGVVVIMYRPNLFVQEACDIDRTRLVQKTARNVERGVFRFDGIVESGHVFLRLPGLTLESIHPSAPRRRLL